MAAELADEPCEACTSEDEPLTEAEYADYLADLRDDVWEVVDGHHLEGTYAFEDFRDALEFTYDVGELAEEEWHHPDIHTQHLRGVRAGVGPAGGAPPVAPGGRRAGVDGA